LLKIILSVALGVAAVFLGIKLTHAT
jgi:hypothetical protein